MFEEVFRVRSVLRASLCVLTLSVAMVARGLGSPAVVAADTARPWLNPALSPDQRARLALRAMTEGEKLTLVLGQYGCTAPWAHYRPPRDARMGSAGFVPGIARLGIPPQWITD